MSPLRQPPIRNALVGTYLVHAFTFPLYLLLAWLISLLRLGATNIGDLYALALVTVLIGPLPAVFVTRIVGRREHRLAPRSVLPDLVNLATIALTVVIACRLTGGGAPLMISVIGSFFAIDIALAIWTHHDKSDVQLSPEKQAEFERMTRDHFANWPFRSSSGPFDDFDKKAGD